MNLIAEHLFAWHQHERTAVVCAGRLVSIARETPDAPTTLSAFVDAIVAGSTSCTIPAGEMQLAAFCAKQIAEHAAVRRMTVTELLRHEHVENDLIRFPTTRRRR